MAYNPNPVYDDVDKKGDRVVYRSEHITRVVTSKGPPSPCPHNPNERGRTVKKINRKWVVTNRSVAPSSNGSGCPKRRREEELVETVSTRSFAPVPQSDSSTSGGPYRWSTKKHIVRYNYVTPSASGIHYRNMEIPGEDYQNRSYNYPSQCPEMDYDDNSNPPHYY